MLADNGHEATSAGNAGVLRRAAAVNVDVDDDAVDVVGTAVLAEGIEVGAGAVILALGFSGGAIPVLFVVLAGTIVFALFFRFFGTPTAAAQWDGLFAPSEVDPLYSSIMHAYIIGTP